LSAENTSIIRSLSTQGRNVDDFLQEKKQAKIQGRYHDVTNGIS
jgi:hypothetical protein